MPKKRKLNSKNPKYLKPSEKDKKEYTKVLIKEVKGCKIYGIWEKD
jgi:hypothetical protein